MRAFACRVCGSALFFENSVCVSCGTNLGYSRGESDIVPVTDGRYVDADGLVWHVCRNLGLSGCTWLSSLEGGQCFSCDLTRTRPSDADLEGLAQFPVAEAAKRHLIVELDALALPIVTRADDPVDGLCFDLLSSVNERVVIGHDHGVITIDLAEGDDVRRVRMQRELGEPYRTMLGHFRHEIGHYYEARLVVGDLVARARELFGDESVPYDAAIDRHYRDGPPPGWDQWYISSYATMHPFEDFAETFAHFLHIWDTLSTAQAYGLIDLENERVRGGSFADLVRDEWIPLSTALNELNGSMGRGPLYPFVLPEPVVQKLEFVASLMPVRN
jgi:hypothetical protein